MPGPGRDFNGHDRASGLKHRALGHFSRIIEHEENSAPAEKQEDLEGIRRSVPVRPDIGPRFYGNAQALDGIGEFGMEVMMGPFSGRIFCLFGK
jgi:hypothetical protein